MNSIFTSFAQGIYAHAYNLFASSSQEDIAKETPPFDIKGWRNLGLKDVKPSEMPKEIQTFLDSACPIWSGKLAKETHFVFPIPANLTLEQLYELDGSHSAPSLVKDFSTPTTKTYWVAITKWALPNTRYIPFSKQKEKLEKYGYEIPNLLEGAAAVVCAKASKFSIFPKDGLFTRCEECLNKWPLAIGSDDFTNFVISVNDVNELNGVAGVRRF